jgi:hypothetical protein
MAKRKPGNNKTKQAANGDNGGIVSLTKELFQAAITLRGSVEPADDKRYVLPIIFLRFLSLRYDRRRAELEALVADKKSDYFGDKKAIHDPDEYRRVGAFVIPEAAQWENLRKAAQADDIKVKLDDVLESLETKYLDKLNGLLPRIYAGSNLDAVSVRGLINLFSKDIFEADHGGDDLIGRVYEYFIGEFASSEGSVAASTSRRSPSSRRSWRCWSRRRVSSSTPAAGLAACSWSRTFSRTTATSSHSGSHRTTGSIKRGRHHDAHVVEHRDPPRPTR